MSNMRYVRFENTSTDLSDCVNTLADAPSIKALDLGTSESSALRDMRDLCEEFLEEYARLEENT